MRPIVSIFRGISDAARRITKKLPEEIREKSFAIKKAKYVRGEAGSWEIAGSEDIALRTDNLQYCAAICLINDDKMAMLHSSQDFDDSAAMAEIIQKIRPREITAVFCSAKNCSSPERLSQKSRECRDAVLERLTRALREAELETAITEKTYNPSILFAGSEVLMRRNLQGKVEVESYGASNANRLRGYAKWLADSPPSGVVIAAGALASAQKKSRDNQKSS